MHRSQPEKLHDELDALLDGRPVELTDELAPLVEAADALRVELAAYQLDPQVADRHLERVLGSPANVVPMPTRPQSGGWDVRRRVVAVALAAALVLAPATMASAAALPGQAMYPFKLAIEQLRLAAVQWSPAREASERTRVADERLSEVQDLLQLRMYNQLPTAIDALRRAVAEAQRAVDEARRKGEPVPTVEAKLGEVKEAGGQTVQEVAAAANGLVPLPADTRDAIQDAVRQTQTVLPPPPTPQATPSGGGTGTSTQATSTTPTSQGTGPTSPPSQTSTPSTMNLPETSTSQATTTTTPPTTVPPTTTAPTTTEDTATPASLGGDAQKDKDKDQDQAGSGDPAPQGYAPPTNVPATTAPPAPAP